jgi:hypothetical protein
MDILLLGKPSFTSLEALAFGYVNSLDTDLFMETLLWKFWRKLLPSEEAIPRYKQSIWGLLHSALLVLPELSLYEHGKISVNVC